MAGGATLFDTAAMYSDGAWKPAWASWPAAPPPCWPRRPARSARREDLPGGPRGEPRASRTRAGIDLSSTTTLAPGRGLRRLMHLMADGVAAGKVTAVGVSNYSAAQPRLAHAALAERGVPLASNQVQYSLLDRDPETNGVLDACRETRRHPHRLPTARERRANRKVPHGARPRGLRRFTPTFRRRNTEAIAAVVTLLREIAARHGVDTTPVALAWLMARGGPVIPGAKNAGQAAANAKALTVHLSTDKVAALDAATLAWRPPD